MKMARACHGCREYVVIHNDIWLSQQRVELFNSYHVYHPLSTMPYKEVRLCNYTSATKEINDRIKKRLGYKG